MTRSDAGPVGDIGDRVLAPVVALRRRGLAVPTVEVGIAATLPAGAGLASSAALIVATITAILRMTAATMTAPDLAAVALSAERDVLGIPCGPLDQRAVIDAPDGGALLLDCATGRGHHGGVALAGCGSRRLRHRDPPRRRWRRVPAPARGDRIRPRRAARGRLSGVERGGHRRGAPGPRDETAPPPRDGREPARDRGRGRDATGGPRRARSPDVGEPSIAARPARGEHPGARRRGERGSRRCPAAPGRGWSAPDSAVPWRLWSREARPEPAGRRWRTRAAADRRSSCGRRRGSRCSRPTWCGAKLDGAWLATRLLRRAAPPGT